MASKWAKNEDIQLFRQYLRIPTAPTADCPDIDYGDCIEFLKRQAIKLGLPCKVYTPIENKPILMMEWTGTRSDLPKILLNSHMDVVPVFPQYWGHPPFEADIDDEGRIFGRGAQDMKSIGIQYLAAIRKLINDRIQLKRTILIMYVPDEEVGGKLGMKSFVPTKEFTCLNVGFALDEGMPVPTEEFRFYIAERPIWRLKFKITGASGHGSLLLDNTVGQKVGYLMNKFLEYRANEVKKLENNPDLTLGDVTTINLTVIKGGIQDNIVPNEMQLTFDCHLALTVDQSAFEAMINRWVIEAGGGIDIKYHQKDPCVPATSLENNPFYDAFKNAMDSLNLTMKSTVFPAGTDSRYLRQAGIPAIGFSPINKTPNLIHDNNEYLECERFLKGIDIYKKIIMHLGDA